MRVTSRSSGHGIVAATSRQAGTLQQLWLLPQPAFRSRRQRREDSTPATIACRLGSSACRITPLPPSGPGAGACMTSRGVHYTAHESARCRATFALPPTRSRRLLSAVPGLSPGRLILLSLSLDSELQSLLDTRVGYCPALDRAQLSSGGQAKGRLQPLCMPILGPLTGRGHTTVRSTLRLGTAPKRPQTRPPAHPWTVDRQPPAWAIACF